MPDRVLPIPNPDWDNPLPVDAPSSEDTELFGHLTKYAHGLVKWVTAAYLQPPTVADWRRLAAEITAVANHCTRHADHKARTVEDREP